MPRQRLDRTFNSGEEFSITLQSLQKSQCAGPQKLPKLEKLPKMSSSSNMKSDPKAAVASEKKAATQLGVIIGMSKSISFIL